MGDSSIQFNWSDVPLYPTSFKPAFTRLVSGTVHLPNGLGHDILLTVFLFFLFGYAIITAVLFYHWDTYGMKNGFIFFAQVTFSVVSVFLLVVAFQLI